MIKDKLEKLRSGKSDINYSSVALIVVKPPSRIISTHRVKNKKEHSEIINKALEKQCCVYLANIERRDGKLYAAQPWVIDLDSVSDSLSGELTPTEPAEPKQDTKSSTLFCPYCDHNITSTPGRTLHVKSRHPEKFEEYQIWLRSLGKN